MPFFVQYDARGNICATVGSDVPPDYPSQLAFDDIVPTDGMMVDLASRTLVPIPAGD